MRPGSSPGVSVAGGLETHFGKPRRGNECSLQGFPKAISWGQLLSPVVTPCSEFSGVLSCCFQPSTRRGPAASFPATWIAAGSAPSGLGARTPAPPPANCVRRKPLGRAPGRSCAQLSRKGVEPPPLRPQGGGLRGHPARLTSLDQSVQGESEADEERRAPGQHGWERMEGTRRRTVCAKAPEE